MPARLPGLRTGGLARAADRDPGPRRRHSGGIAAGRAARSLRTRDRADRRTGERLGGPRPRLRRHAQRHGRTPLGARRAGAPGPGRDPRRRAVGSDFVTALAAGFELQARLGRVDRRRPLRRRLPHDRHRGHLRRRGGLRPPDRASTRPAGFRNALGLAGTQAAGTQVRLRDHGEAPPRRVARRQRACWPPPSPKGGFTANPAHRRGRAGLLDPPTPGREPSLDASRVEPSGDRFVRCATRSSSTTRPATSPTRPASSPIGRLRRGARPRRREGRIDRDRGEPQRSSASATSRSRRPGSRASSACALTAALALLGLDTEAIRAPSPTRRSTTPEVVAMRDRVTVADGKEPRGTQARSRRSRRRRARLSRRETDTGVPAADLAAQRARLEAKFGRLAATRAGRSRRRIGRSSRFGEIDRRTPSTRRICSLSPVANPQEAPMPERTGPALRRPHPRSHPGARRPLRHGAARRPRRRRHQGRAARGRHEPPAPPEAAGPGGLRLRGLLREHQPQQAEHRARPEGRGRSRPCCFEMVEPGRRRGRERAGRA